MKRQIFSFILKTAISAAVLTSCSKDPSGGVGGGGGIYNGTLNISVENGRMYSDEIDKVKLVVWDESAQKEVTLTSSKFGDKGVIPFELPATVPAKYLHAFMDEDVPPTLKVSNTNAKFTSASLDAYNGNDYVDEIIYGKVINKEKGLYAIANLLYFESEVTVNGTEKWTRDNIDGGESETNINYSLSLKKGWNLVYVIVESVVSTGKKEVWTARYTSADPGGLKWYLAKESDFDDLWGKEVDVVVEFSLPTLSTNPAYNVTDSEATLGGNIAHEGFPRYYERGVCYATTPNPTTAKDIVVDNTWDWRVGGTGNFSVEIFGLTPNTKYYARAYAINEEGTAYGEQISFTTTP